jgi:hypothetical protein
MSPCANGVSKGEARLLAFYVTVAADGRSANLKFSA